MSNRDRDHAIPEGMNFLRLLWREEDRLEDQTDGAIPEMGRKAPACLAEIGTALSLLDRMASCWWECRGGDHLLEYLCGRVASTGGAALRLTRLGFYDEALLLCRSVGEIANLLSLFRLDEPALGNWKNATRAARVREFGPAKVRIRLEELGETPPIDEERYRLLSERAAHVHPKTKPQAYNLLDVPSAAARYQEQGVLICLNELARALAFCMIFGSALLKFEKPLRSQIQSAARKLAEQIGGVAITERDAILAAALEDEATRAELDKIRGAVHAAQLTRRRSRSSDES